MTKQRAKGSGKGAIELLDEAVQLVRRASPGILAAYYVGTLPFALWLLYFWADMSVSADARARCAGGALGLAALFIWMKAWHAVYARALLNRVSGNAGPRWTLGRFLRTAATQAFTQASALVLLPVALATAVPFPQTYAFYQNVTILDAGERESSRDLWERAWAQSALWPRQNLAAVWLLSPFPLMAAAGLYLVAVPFILTVTPEWTNFIIYLYAGIFGIVLAPLSPLGIVIAANFAVLLILLPAALHSFLGIDTVLIGAVVEPDNSIFMAVVVVLAYLCMDPLMKAVYVLRCFYGMSLHTGADLLADLNVLASQARRVLPALLVVGLLASVAASAEGATPSAAEAVAGPDQCSVSASDLDQAIADVMNHREYLWRMPRDTAIDELGQDNALLQYVREAARQALRVLRKVVHWVLDVIEWLRDKLDGFAPRRESGGWSTMTDIILSVLLAVLLSILAVVLLRLWRNRGLRPAMQAAQPLVSEPDLEDENTGADELPEDGWRTLARQLMAEGKYRMAVRALFLAGLAYLAETRLITIARFKSNSDYERELCRRAHVQSETLAAFRETAAAFERVWYGTHEAGPELAEEFLRNQDRMRIGVQNP